MSTPPFSTGAAERALTGPRSPDSHVLVMTAEFRIARNALGCWWRWPPHLEGARPAID
jgi:hypothetical protein